MSSSAASPSWLTSGRMNFWLVAIGLSLLVLYRVGVRVAGPRDIIWFTQLALCQSALYLVVVWLLLRAGDCRSTLLIVIVFAAIFRLSVLFFPPYLSDDIYRYIWDGRVQATGINPYRYIPADSALASLRDERIYPRINRRDYAHTMYPPLAECIYFLTTRVSESVTWMKATMIFAEAVTIWALAVLLASFGLPRQRIIIYAWHPLVVWEFAGNGHVDALAIAFIALALLARRRKLSIVTGIALACATLVKLFPLVLFPALYRRRNWKMPIAFAITLICGYLPYISVGPKGVLGFLPGYAGERGITSGEQFYVLSVARWLIPAWNIPASAFVVLAIVILSLIAVWPWRKRERGELSYLGRALVLACTFTVLFAPHFSWYFAWLIPLLCFLPLAPLFYLTIASFLLYATWIGDKPNQMLLLNSYIYIPFAILCMLAFWNRRKWQAREDQVNLTCT